LIRVFCARNLRFHIGVDGQFDRRQLSTA